MYGSRTARSPKPFEWILLYFKELALFGSSTHGLETVGGKRANCIEIYLDLLAQNRLNVDGLITHRYPLEHYAEAFLAARKKRGAPGDQGDLRSHGEHT